jgi:hypothetical protein
MSSGQMSQVLSQSANAVKSGVSEGQKSGQKWKAQTPCLAWLFELFLLGPGPLGQQGRRDQSPPVSDLA